MTAELQEAAVVEHGTEVAPYQSGSVVPMRSGSALIALAGSIDEIVQAQENYQKVCRALLDAGDVMKIGDREFKKKSAFRKLSVAFGVNLELVSVTHERNEAGHIIRTEVIARAVATNGRYADGIGAADLHEKCCPGEGHCTKETHWEDSGKVRHVHCTADCLGHYSNPSHDIPATAATRATNRAAADLFGMGEVSAEEITERDEGDPRQNWSGGGNNDASGSSQQSRGNPISEKQLGFLNNLLGEKGKTVQDLAGVIGRSAGQPEDLTSREASKAIEHLQGMANGVRERPVPVQVAPDVEAEHTGLPENLDDLIDIFRAREMTPAERKDAVEKALGRPLPAKNWASTLSVEDVNTAIGYLAQNITT